MEKCSEMWIKFWEKKNLRWISSLHGKSKLPNVFENTRFVLTPLSPCFRVECCSAWISLPCPFLITLSKIADADLVSKSNRVELNWGFPSTEMPIIDLWWNKPKWDAWMNPMKWGMNELNESELIFFYWFLLLFLGH